MQLTQRCSSTAPTVSGPRALRRHARPARRVAAASTPATVVQQQASTSSSTAPPEAAAAASLSAPLSASLDGAAACPVLRQLQPLPPPFTRNVFKSIGLTLGIPIESSTKIMGEREISSSLFMGAFPISHMGSVPSIRDALQHEAAGKVKAVLPAGAEALVGKESISVMTNMDQHRQMRQHLATVLGPDAVSEYMPDISQIIIESLDAVVAECQARNKPVAVMTVFKQMTLRVICRVVLDMSPSPKELEKFSEEFHTFVKNIFTVAPLDVWPFPFHQSMNARRKIVKRIQKRVAEVRDIIAREPDQLQRSAIKRLLLARDDQGQPLTDLQLEDNLVVLLFAGHDTTASLVTRLLWDVSLHPHVLSKLRLEQERITRKHGPIITPAALADMDFAAAVVAETFRLNPVIPGAIRLAHEDIDVQGYLVPKNTPVVYEYGLVGLRDPRWPAHMDPKDPFHPSKYNPDRFMFADSGGGRNTGAQMPFGAGPRMCAGVSLAQSEIKVFLAQLVRNYDWVVDIGSTQWTATPSVSIYPTNGLPTWIERRQGQP